MNAEVEVIREAEEGAHHTGHRCRVDFPALRIRMCRVESSKPAQPVHERMLLSFGLCLFRQTPRRGQHSLDVVEKKIGEREPVLRPTDFLADGYKPVAMRLKRNDR